MRVGEVERDLLGEVVAQRHVAHRTRVLPEAQRFPGGSHRVDVLFG